MTWNLWQPVRPRSIINAQNKNIPLLYRTTFRPTERKPYLWSWESMLITCRLYHAVRNNQIGTETRISELHAFICGDTDISKRFLGNIVVQTTIYEPRVLMNRRGIGAHNNYLFHHILDFQYGLEWILCTWFHEYMNQTLPSNERICDRESYDSELTLFANSDLVEFEEDLLEFSRDKAPREKQDLWERIPPDYEEYNPAKVRKRGLAPQ